MVAIRIPLMASLNQIPGLTPDAVELLAGAGIANAQALARLDPEKAYRELELAAWRLARSHKLPSRETVEQWIARARELPGVLDDIPVGDPVDEEDIPEAIIEEAPVIPSTANRYLPPAQRAQRETAGIGGKTAGEGEGAALPAAAAREFAPGVGIGAGRREVDAKRFATFEDYKAGRLKVEPLQRLAPDVPEEVRKHHHKERVKEGEKLSRWHRRGVVHPRPVFITLGAIVSLLWRLAMAAAVVGVPWFLFTVENPADHKGSALAVFGALVTLGIAQMIFMSRARCRICSCQLFHSRNCIKNRKAHLIPGIGYTASLALHLLIFQWFRCMYCGTAIRLRPGSHDRGQAHRKG